jgi:D-glycero-beta-D-manno-heptose 1-phosphate adenylyltransferase
MSTIVTCNGCFDGIHPGHLFFLGFCKAQGDKLIVGINSDNYIKKHKREKPLYNEKQRVKSLMSLGFIKDVVVFHEDTPIEFIKNSKTDIHCNGAEYGKDCIESNTLNEMGARLVLIPRTPIWSTSDLKDESSDIVNKTMKILLR